MTKLRLLLRQLRLEQELSQEELARALSVSRQSIISLERGEYLPSAPLLIALMEFFNCPIEQLVDGVKLVYEDDRNVQEQVIQNKENWGGGDQQMQLTSSSPFQAMDRMQDEMNQMVERTFGRGDWSRTLGTVAGAMNIHETDKHYELEIQVTGYTDSDINIEMTEDTLTISGNKKHEEESEGKSLVRREWQHSQFSRSIKFSNPIKEDKVEAKLENGTLVIVAPKVEPIKPKVKKIEVKKS